jgi:hemerythrin-like metal-binding protein
MRKLLQSELETYKGLNLYFFRNGKDAFDFFLACKSSQITIDLIISDWEMPEMSGIDLLKKIRSNSQKHIPYIMLTSNNYSDQVIDAITEGVDHYLIKPVVIDNLIEKISSALNCKNFIKENRKISKIVNSLSNQYSVNDKTIDSQHSRIIDMITLLLEKKDINNDELNEILLDLAKYTHEHFEYEENLMKNLKYSKYKTHKLLHKSFYNEVVELSRSYKGGLIKNSSYDVLDFLLKWFYNHILQEDQDIFINNKN